MRRLAVLPLCLMEFAAAQTAPPKVFELQAPELGDARFEGGVVELPAARIRKLVIHVLNPVADQVSYGKIFPRLNGDAASVICQYRATAQGKSAVLDLAMRPDIGLRPGVNTLEVTVINARGRRYYRNWILRTREQARNEWFAYDSSVAPDDENGSAPDILIASPETPVMFASGERSKKVVVEGTVSAANPLSQFSIAGQALALGDANPASFRRELNIPKSIQQILVEATDRKSNRTRVIIPVRVQTTGPPPKLTGDRYALVIGISHYKTQAGPFESRAASTDADALASVLTSKAGFRPDRVMLLRDERATAAQIRNAFRNFAGQAKPDDLMIVYFAGYGLHDPLNPEKIYLTAYDTQVAQLADTAFEVSEIETLLETNLRSRRAILLFDVGHRASDDISFAGSNLINRYLLRLFSKEHGRAVLVSAGVNEDSAETHSEGRSGGVFAHWFLEGLSGEADWNHDGLVTVAELFRFVADRVRNATHGSQTPLYQIADQELPVSSQGKP